MKVVRSLTLPGPTRLWDLIGLAARLLLAAVYFVSGILKAADPAETRVAVKGYQLQLWHGDRMFVYHTDLARTRACPAIETQYRKYQKSSAQQTPKSPRNQPDKS